MSRSIAKALSVELLHPKDAKWLKLVKITYEDETGKTRIWEAVSHTNRPRNCAVDAVQVVAILEKSTGPELLLEKQFRPPVGKVVVQFPAGFIGEGETPDQAAVRELKEETGYIGEVIQNTKERRPILYPCPGLLSSRQYLIRVKINLDIAENKEPKTALEDGEVIECFSVLLKDLRDHLIALEDQGYSIHGIVGTFAEGIETARLWNL